MVIGAGAIVEQGSHTELLERNGTYARLVEAQKLNSSAVNSAPSTTQEPEEDVAVQPQSITSLQRKGTKESIGSKLFGELGLDTGDEFEDMYGLAYVLRRCYGLNSEHRTRYILGVIGAVCSGLVYPGTRAIPTSLRPSPSPSLLTSPPCGDLLSIGHIVWLFHQRYVFDGISSNSRKQDSTLGCVVPGCQLSSLCCNLFPDRLYQFDCRNPCRQASGRTIPSNTEGGHRILRQGGEFDRLRGRSLGGPTADDRRSHRSNSGKCLTINGDFDWRPGYRSSVRPKASGSGDCVYATPDQCGLYVEASIATRRAFC